MMKLKHGFTGIRTDFGGVMGLFARHSGLSTIVLLALLALPAAADNVYDVDMAFTVSADYSRTGTYDWPDDPDQGGVTGADFLFNGDGGGDYTWKLNDGAGIILRQGSGLTGGRFFPGVSGFATLTFTSDSGAPGQISARGNDYAAMRIGNHSGSVGGTVNIEGGVAVEIGWIWAHAANGNASLNVLDGEFAVFSDNATKRLNGIDVTIGPDGTLWIQDPTGSVTDVAGFEVFASGATLAASGGGQLFFTNHVQRIAITGGAPVVGTLITVDPGADPRLVVASPQQFTNDGNAETLFVPIGNGGVSNILSISSVTPGGADAGFLTVSSYDASLAPGGNGTINLAFDPTLSGGGDRSYTATLTINSNDSADPVRVVEIHVASYSGPPGPDWDGDDLPNDWETTYGLDPLDDGSINPDNGAEGDPDDDGLPNRDEYFLGSSPTNPQDPDGRAWQPRPEKAHLLVISTHPDDEGIFFGGLLPYATQVRRLNTVLVNMVSDRVTINPTIREGELRGAAWQYGLRNQPVFARFMDHAHLGSINSLTLAWDTWDGDDTDGVADDNNNGIPDGREVGALYIAEQIRRYRPEVVASHDIAGEYGHGAHQASALCTIDAFTLAADPAADIAGLPPWQAKKLYIHKYATHPLFHDFWEDATIDDGGVMKSPRQVADEGLNFHVTQGRPDVNTVYRSDDNYGENPGEWWGLYASTVGSDTVEPDFIAPDANNSPITYSGWARGDFFEHLTVFPDSDSDELPDDWELARFVSLAAADPQADDDHDGFDNRYEFVAGLGPHTPDRTEFVINADAASVDFTVPGTTGVTGYEGLTRRYQLLHSPDMLDWSTVVAEGVADGTPLTYLIGDAGESGDRGFYRLALSIE
jgi:LmbE family N-acetylglucosaminyl deacetylase